MKKLLSKKVVALLLLGLVAIGFGCGGVWVLNREEQKIAAEELTDDFMEEYLGAYAEMMQKGEQENVLVVVNNERPNDYGAIDMVEGPNRTYFLMYDSEKARDEAYVKFEMDGSTSVEKNVMLELMNYRSWGIELMGLDDAIDAIGDNGEHIMVAVIDTGLDVDLFRENFPDTELVTYDVETSSSDESNMSDVNGHGTHVTGIVAEGVPKNVSIYAIRATRTNDKQLYSSDVTTAIYQAIAGGAKVINMSMGSYTQVPSQKLAIDYAEEQNIIVVASAGNDSKTDILYPAGFDNTLSVTAINNDFSFPNYANYGDTIDFAAPGTYVSSINGWSSGTSMAAPHVVAAVAVLKSFNPSLSFADTKNLLIQHTMDLGEPGWDRQYGYGLIDFNDAEFCVGDNYCDKFGVFVAKAGDFEVEDLTMGVAQAEVLEDGVVVEADKACTVIVSYDGGGSYTKVPAEPMDGEENKFRFYFETTTDMGVAVTLKGDGDLDGEITTADSNMVNRSLISPTLRPYQTLTTFQQAILDVNGDDEVTTADSNLINRSLISPTLRPYEEIQW